MRAIEGENDDLKDVLPKTYNRLDNRVLFNLLKNFNSIPMDIEGRCLRQDLRILPGQLCHGGGAARRRVLHPHLHRQADCRNHRTLHGRIYDPACGSGGMFVQSADFVQRHRLKRSYRHTYGSTISIYGQERVAETVRLCKMNLAVHGLAGDIRQANSYYEDLHNSPGQVRLRHGQSALQRQQYRQGAPQGRHGPLPLRHAAAGQRQLYLDTALLQLFERYRLGPASSWPTAPATRASPSWSMRKQLIADGAVDVMVSIGSNFFYTVTLPCTLWFLDKGKRGTQREDKVLFLDARHIYRQLDRAHRDFTEEQIAFLASIVRLYRGEDLKYADVAGLCKVTSREEIESQGWSLNPGRYVGVSQYEKNVDNFIIHLQELSEELEKLNFEAKDLEIIISGNISKITGMSREY
jgi:type I restriction enzyme M protein